MRHLILLLAIIASLMNPVQVLSNFKQEAGASAVPETRVVVKRKDFRLEKLKAFLSASSSPLTGHASDFIKAAEKYGLDECGLLYLVPAITGVESSFGKHYPEGSYNAYGWANGQYYFTSWEKSIDHVSRVLGEKYIGRGADNVWEIGPIYARSPTWASRVAYFIQKIEATPPEPMLTI